MDSDLSIMRKLPIFISKKMYEKLYRITFEKGVISYGAERQKTFGKINRLT